VEGQPGGSEVSAPELEQLMVRYQSGDAIAAKTLIDLLTRQLFSFFASQAENRADAADMTQDLWLRIHRVRHTYRPGEPILPWVYAIARRVRIDNYRKSRRIRSREVATDVLPPGPATTQPASEMPSFTDLVSPLPASQREALTLLKVNGLSIEEIARATASTPGAVKQKLHRAYERLRTLLKPGTTPAAGGAL
jgi:RNA polymerase sigma-70 factor (ECF subfamily)